MTPSSDSDGKPQKNMDTLIEELVSYIAEEALRQIPASAVLRFASVAGYVPIWIDGTGKMSILELEQLLATKEDTSPKCAEPGTPSEPPQG
jgi:hypothetical protein